MAFVEIKKSRQVQQAGSDRTIVVLGATVDGIHGFSSGDLFGSDSGALGRRAWKISTKPEQPVPGVYLHEIVYLGHIAY